MEGLLWISSDQRSDDRLGRKPDLDQPRVQLPIRTSRRSAARRTPPYPPISASSASSVAPVPFSLIEPRSRA